MCASFLCFMATVAGENKKEIEKNISRYYWKKKDGRT